MIGAKERHVATIRKAGLKEAKDERSRPKEHRRRRQEVLGTSRAGGNTALRQKQRVRQPCRQEIQSI
jgi:hypothetical protein